jgi:hypothetical protein
MNVGWLNNLCQTYQIRHLKLLSFLFYKINLNNADYKKKKNWVQSLYLSQSWANGMESPDQLQSIQNFSLGGKALRLPSSTVHLNLD